MKRFILTLAALMACAVSFAQVTTKLAESGKNSLEYYAKGGNYILNIGDVVDRGTIDIFVMNKKEMLGTLEIMEGMFSGKFPAMLGLYKTGAYIGLCVDTGYSVIVVDYGNWTGNIKPEDIRVFRAALKLQN